ncbi:AP-4 complex subunit epsilon [Olea europaea subsp. europaea]|uniref:AP-4 complex subunit epsilon n=1 Tax=Olea europaea subsp. europaea TaxID=158383 RepID=A0A8S0S7J1_OLEEU|nr:AP-4 complex subunit epsilon [Olea europaea subsp. europaea]
MMEEKTMKPEGLSCTTFVTGHRTHLQLEARILTPERTRMLNQKEPKSESHDDPSQPVAIHHYNHQEVYHTALQVICWVLGEYGTTDGKYPASFITRKLCDVAEAHSTNDTVKLGLAGGGAAVGGGRELQSRSRGLRVGVVTSEIARSSEDRPVDKDAIQAQQGFGFDLNEIGWFRFERNRYALMIVVLLILKAYAVTSLMKIYSFEIAAGSKVDMLPEIDKNLSFLDAYVEELLEKGAQPYSLDDERSGLSNTSNFRSQDHESSTHAIRSSPTC